MTETEPIPAPASPLHQCYERTFSLLSKLAAGALVHADPQHVQEFLKMLQDAHLFLDEGLPQAPPADTTEPDSRQPTAAGPAVR